MNENAKLLSTTYTFQPPLQAPSIKTNVLGGDRLEILPERMTVNIHHVAGTTVMISGRRVNRDGSISRQKREISYRAPFSDLPRWASVALAEVGL